MDISEKLRILSGAAKYDVSCSSSGVIEKGHLETPPSQESAIPGQRMEGAYHF